MRIKKSSPALLFIGLAILSFLLAGIALGNTALDIHMHDTYFVIAHSHLIYLTSFYFAFIGLLYFAFRNCLLSKWFYRIHFIGTVICFIVILLPKFSISTGGQVRQYVDCSGWESIVQFAELNILIASIVILFLLLQIGFVFYVFIGAVKCLSNK